MKLFDEYFGDKSPSDLQKMSKYDLFILNNSKSRTKKWLAKCLDGAIEANEKSIAELDDRILKAKIKLINGDQSQFREIMELRFIKEETMRQTPFLNELKEELF